jgi:tRNA A37 threonylcarbamoyladenosine synthetase subunit TsaC/SUA5/YrdC
LRNYSELSSFTNITAEQLVFLSKYPYPFTLLVTPSEFFSYPGYMDRIRYSKIAFRIAEKCLPEDIREELPYPMFLTSANKSKESETYSSDEVAGVFAVWIDSMKIFDAVIEKKSLPSDIFEFIDTTTDIRYLRKNHN